MNVELDEKPDNGARPIVTKSGSIVATGSL